MSRGTISIRTEITGPKSREIAVRKEKVVPSTLGTLAPFHIAEGKGALVRESMAISSSISLADGGA